MGKGREIMGWWEPGEWLRAAKEHAKAEGIRTYPVKPMLITFAMLGGLLAYKWSEADPAKRVSPLGAVMILVILCLVITGLVRLMGAINRTRTSLHEHGLLHGPLDSRRWIPYGTIQLFTIEEDEIGGRRFRFLIWFEEQLEEESCSVLPEAVDAQRVIEMLKSKGVEYREKLDEG